MQKQNKSKQIPPCSKESIHQDPLVTKLISLHNSPILNTTDRQRSLVTISDQTLASMVKRNKPTGYFATLTLAYVLKLLSPLTYTI